MTGSHKGHRQLEHRHDRVFVADADAESYSRPIGRNLLYVACTRAMHCLAPIAEGRRSPFLPKEQP